MKRKCLLFFILLVCFCLTACSSTAGSSYVPEKQGVAPCELSEQEKNLLESFGMGDTSRLIGFHAPKGATVMEVTVYQLGKDGAWQPVGQGAISTGKEEGAGETLSGTVALQLLENYRTKFTIRSSGSSSFTSDAIPFEGEVQSSMTGFLQEFESAELNSEIPVALMVYDSGTKMKSYTLADYFDPSQFVGMDLVQAITVKFFAE